MHKVTFNTRPFPASQGLAKSSTLTLLALSWRGWVFMPSRDRGFNSSTTDLPQYTTSCLCEIRFSPQRHGGHRANFLFSARCRQTKIFRLASPHATRVNLVYRYVSLHSLGDGKSPDRRKIDLRLCDFCAAVRFPFWKSTSHLRFFSYLNFRHFRTL